MKTEVIISQLINQATEQLIGGIWTDKNGKINHVGLAIKGNSIMPDFPENEEILDVAQIGIRYEKPL